jgi:hypothetical protein
MFVTQPPFGGDFSTVNAAFGNHNASTAYTPRGGDLYIRYGDGALRNLTAEAGYGLQPRSEIAVREPSVHWSGAKALFSMVVGGTTKDDYSPVYWQIYEVTGIAQGQIVSIRRLAQPADSNNVSPIYGTDDRIIFTSDRPRDGNRLLYPQLDEYESVPTNTGLWSMNADGTDLKLLDHATSGDFTPTIASDGRVIFTRWDHLQRDQQNNDGTRPYGAFNYASESSAQQLPANTEVFPEPRTQPSGSYYHGHTMHHFFPWQMNEDGTALETLNHIGRHELIGYFNSSHQGLPEFIAPSTRRVADNLFQFKEDPLRPGYFYCTRAHEFGTHAAGQIVGILAAESVNADNMQIDYVTNPISATALADGQSIPAGHPGLMRNPTPLTDGTILCVQTSVPYSDREVSGILSSRYNFRLVRLQQGAPYYTPGGRLIAGGVFKAISYWDNQSYSQLSYSGEMWELDPVEVVARPRPPRHTNPLPAIEAQILDEELGGPSGVDGLRSFLQSRGLALVVSRNVTRRADRQQDYNLKIFGSATQTAEPGATPVEIKYLQFIQADLIRGYTNFRAGRRAIGQPMHDGLGPPLAEAPQGGVALGADGSMAAFVPARRALSWQLVKPAGEPVVRERYWVTFAAGEMRSCTNCHGINRVDTVLGQPAPVNPPQALRDLLRWYRATFGGGPACSFSISPASASFSSSGGTGAITVNTTAGCNWTATTGVGWISITQGVTGSGSGEVRYTVSANTSTLARAASITVAGQTFSVSQSGATPACSYSISPTSASYSASGGAGAVTVNTSSGCAWTATVSVGWVTITQGATGSGAGEARYTVSANASALSRSASMTIAGQTFSITQAGAAPVCSYSISPTSAGYAASGGAGAVSISAGAGCAWTAASNVAWIQITSAAAGSGNGAVNYTVDANTGGARTGTMTIAGQTFTVDQAAAPPTQCAFQISPTSRTHRKGKDTGTITVTAPAGCAWTAASQASWITITAGATGSGSGVVTYSVSRNTTGLTRTGTIKVGGQLFTVKQRGS